MSEAKGFWFVRSNGGSGSYPINGKGWLVVLIFLLIVGVSAFLGLWMMSRGIGPNWIWVPVFVGGMIVGAGFFMWMARAHTDYATTYNEYRKRVRG